jgi:hypothetical protein
VLALRFHSFVIFQTAQWERGLGDAFEQFG